MDPTKSGTSLSDLFNTGIGAVRDVLVARSSNDPTPNSRGQNDVTAPAGSPASLSAVFNPTTLVVLAAIGVAVYLLVRR